MMNAKCGCKSKKLCPVSFGLALGTTCFFAVLVWTLWVINHGVSPMMVAMHMPMPTLGNGFEHALFALFKGFVFGFFVAFFYDVFSCWFRSCKKSNGKCECECSTTKKTTKK